MEYLCHKRPRISSTCRKRFPVLSSFMSYHEVCFYINTTGANSGTETAYPSGALEFTPGFSGVRVTRALVLCVCFVDRCLSFNTFAFGHFVVCSSSLYKFWLPLWFLQTRLIVLFVYFCIEWCPTFCCCSVLCFLFCLSSYCVPNVASFSGLSILDCPLGFLSLSRLFMKVQMWHLNHQIFILP